MIRLTHLPGFVSTTNLTHDLLSVVHSTQPGVGPGDKLWLGRPPRGGRFSLVAKQCRIPRDRTIGAPTSAPCSTSDTAREICVWNIAKGNLFSGKAAAQ